MVLAAVLREFLHAVVLAPLIPDRGVLIWRFSTSTLTIAWRKQQVKLVWVRGRLVDVDMTPEETVHCRNLEKKVVLQLRKLVTSLKHGGKGVLMDISVLSRHGSCQE